MIEDMTMRKLSPKTQSAYIRAVKKLTQYLHHSPDTATAEELRLFQLHLVELGTSSITLNATITGLTFFFEVTANCPDALTGMSRVYEPRKLPIILSIEEVTRLLEAAGGLKYKAVLSIAYGAGLRASEVVHLKVSDIDSQRMVLRIEQGKGKKGPLCDALADTAGVVTRLVSTCPFTTDDTPGWLVVSGTKPGEPNVHPTSQPHIPHHVRGCRDRQASIFALVASCLRHPPAGAERGHSRDPGTVGTQEA